MGVHLQRVGSDPGPASHEACDPLTSRQEAAVSSGWLAHLDRVGAIGSVVRSLTRTVSDTQHSGATPLPDLLLRGVRHAEDRPRPRLQPAVRNRSATDVALAVGLLVELLQRTHDVGASALQLVV